jgi:(p)ppGpp synthase/HD superfamily hydrolase
MLATAIRIASQVHEHQKDKGGNAYILHPMRVMMRLRTSDEELMAIAILHDVVEDSSWTPEMLKDAGMSDRVITALGFLTKLPTDTYEMYIQRMVFNRDAMLVKLQDLKDNSDISRMKGLRDKDFERLVKYNKAYAFLEGKLKE